MAFEPGMEIKVPYPFIMDAFQTMGDEDGPGALETCWRPGIDQRFTSCEGDSEEFCHGNGFMVLTVVDVHKPGKYPVRVFYTRRWIDPDGKVFGKPALRVTPISAFTRMTKGYRYPARISPDGVREAAERLAKSIGCNPSDLLARMGVA